MGYEPLTISSVENHILEIRNTKVIVDADLAELYGVPTKRLNEQVKRNLDRFPNDFAFRLTGQEKSEVVAKCDHLSNLKYSHTLPLVFTEHGAIMAASVLNSETAVQMSVVVVRAFVTMRRNLRHIGELKEKLNQVEERMEGHDQSIKELMAALKQLFKDSRVPKKRRIGFSLPEANE